MNPNTPKNPDFWRFVIRANAEAPGSSATGHRVLADWLDEHDDPIRAHVFRYGEPERLVGHRTPEALAGSYHDHGNHGDPQANGVAFPDEAPVVRQFKGDPSSWTSTGDIPWAEHEGVPNREHLHILRADAVHDRNNQRWVARYTLDLGARGRIRLVAPLTPEQIEEWGHLLDNPRMVSVGHRVRNPGILAGTMGQPDYSDPHSHAQPQRLARVKLGASRPDTTFGGTEHDVHDETTGEKLGSVSLEGKGRSILHVNMIQGKFGPEAVRTLARAIKEQYPEATHFTGFRVSGWRGEHPENVTVPVEDVTKLARLTLSPPKPYGQPFGGGGTINEHRILDEQGNDQGFVRVQPKNDGRNLHIHLIGRRDDAPAEDANSLGGEALRSIAGGLAEHYPDAQFIQGHRGTSVGSGFRGTVTGKPPLVVFPIRRPAKQARQVYKAPGGGAISGGLFQKGGQFMAKARKRIRDVAARLVTKLARPEEDKLRGFIDSLRENKKDDHARAVFADFLEENGFPGAHIVRWHAEHGLASLGSAGQLIRNRLGLTFNRTPMVTVSDTPHRFTEPGETKDVVTGDNTGYTYAQAFWSPRHPERGIAVGIMHHKADGTESPIAHVAHASNVEELRHLLSDFPVKAKVALLKNLRRIGTEKFAPSKLARNDQKTSFRALLGDRGPGEPYDHPLTLGQLKSIENAHALPEEHRLSPHTFQPKGAVGDEHPYVVPIERAINFLGHLTRSALGPVQPHELQKVLANPQHAETAKQDHLIARLLEDQSDSPKGDWYSGAIDALDKAIHDHYGIGKLDADGKLIGKGEPHEHHPELVLFKTLIGITSPMANPVDNTRTALRVFNEARRKAALAGTDDWVSHITPRDDKALADWYKKLQEAWPGREIPNPGTEATERAKWYAKWVEPVVKEVGVPQYSASEARVFFHKNGEEHPHHGVLLYEKGRAPGQVKNRNRAAPNEKRTTAKAKFVPIPLVNPDGSLRARGWGGSTDIWPSVQKLQSLVNRFRTPDGTTQSAYRKAAQFLFTFHDRNDPALTPADRKAMFGKGLFDAGEKAPGFLAVGGPKTGVFMTNLHANDPATRETHGDLFTHDTWMQRMLLTHLGRLTTDAESKQVTNQDRTEFRDAARAIAKRLGITPAELQADLWYYAQGAFRRLGVDADRIGSYSFRDAANKLLPPKKLMRSPDPSRHDALLDATRATQDPVALGVLGDHLEETGLPGAELARVAHEQGRKPRGYTYDPATQHQAGHILTTGGWVGEDGPQPGRSYRRNWLEVLPSRTEHGLHLHVVHTGSSGLRSAEYGLHVRDRETLKRVLDSLPDRMRAGLISALHQVSGTQLSRELHSSLLKSLGGKTWKRHSKRVAIQKHGDNSISVFVHGKRMKTVHADGSVKHHPGKFYGAKAEKPEKAEQLARTLPPSGDTKAFSGQLWAYPEEGHRRTPDTTAARVYADYLREHDDWRHHLMDRIGELGDSGHWERRDGTQIDLGRHPHVPQTYVPFGPGQGDAEVFWGRQGVVVNHRHGGDPIAHLTHHPMTYPEYDAMRQEASTAGVNFPEAPHDPA